MRAAGLCLLSGFLGFVVLAWIHAHPGMPLGGLCVGASLVQLGVVGALVDELERQALPSRLVFAIFLSWGVVLVGGLLLWCLGR